MGKTNPKAGRFEGFDRGAMRFWGELAAEMNRDWFHLNKDRYESLWVRPMASLLEEVAAKLTATYAPLKLGAPKVLRIHRDVRFSRDKAPYKTHIGAVITVAGKKLGEGGNAAMYVHIGVEEDFVGVGTYTFEAAKLAAWRKAVTGKQGAVIDTLMAALRKKGYAMGGHDDFKRVPRGFDPEHPRAALLKLRGLTAGFPVIPRGLLFQRAFADWLVEHGRATAPLVIWLHRNVG